MARPVALLTVARPLATLLCLSLLAQAQTRREDPFATGPEAPISERGPGGRYTMRFASAEERSEDVRSVFGDPDGVRRGLEWLAAHQQEDGRWVSDGSDLTATSLALLAFLGDGETSRRGAHREVVRDGLTWLANQQDEDSGLVGETDHEHGWATYALLEGAYLGPEEKLLEPARAAFAHGIRTTEKGAWLERGEPDVVATSRGMFLALAAIEAGVGGVEPMAAGIQWLRTQTRDNGAVTRRRGAHGYAYRSLASALAAYQLGSSGPPRVVERLCNPRHRPAWPGAGEEVDYAYWFWGAQGLPMQTMLAEGALEWRSAAVASLREGQSEDGSWPANGPPDYPGAVEATSLAVMTLEGPYRYLPVDPRELDRLIAGQGNATPKFGGRRNLRALGGEGTEEALGQAIQWLVAQQEDDGRWSSAAHGGHADHDVGVTSLVLLVLLGDGNGPLDGTYADSVVEGVRWLLAEQDRETGHFSEAGGTEGAFEHALATIVLMETQHCTASPSLEAPCRAALDHLVASRNADGTWGDQGGSEILTALTTAWNTIALVTARECGHSIDQDQLERTWNRIASRTDNRTGLVGPEPVGDRRSAETAASLLLRFLLGHVRSAPHMVAQSEYLAANRPKPGATPDPEYLFWGSYALFQFGRTAWKDWNEAMKSTVLRSRHTEEQSKVGSWDPSPLSVYDGGRVYATAHMALCLEVYFRYARIQRGR